jgi:hypothetical protein
MVIDVEPRRRWLDRWTGALVLGLVLVAWNWVEDPSLRDDYPLVGDYSEGVEAASYTYHPPAFRKPNNQKAWQFRGDHCQRLTDQEYGDQRDWAYGGGRLQGWPEPAVAYWQGCMGYAPPGLRPLND